MALSDTRWGLAAILMLATWAISIMIKNAGIVDIGWALGLILLTFFYADQAGEWNLRTILIVVMVAIWGLRLSILLLKRILRDRREDKRYQTIREQWKTHVNVKFFALFQFEALLDVVLAIPFLLIIVNPNPKFLTIEMIGVLIWIIGLVGETIADGQLKKFKDNPANRGKTCDIGLWYYSRHPNYFFEWVMWFGYFIFALGSPGGAIAIVCPIIMYYFLIYVTGVPTAEAQSLMSRGEEYRRYQQSTSMFVPLPKRKI